MSPVIAATPSLMLWRKPELTATATIITKKLTAVATAAMFPLNFILRDMKESATKCVRALPPDGT